MAADPCEVCGGVGYRVSRRGELAFAELCVCKQICPLCDNRRFVIVDDAGYDIARPCSCIALNERIRLYNEAGIPGAYVDAHLSSFKTSFRDPALKRDVVVESLEMARVAVNRYSSDAVLDPETRGLVLLGGPGAGKTHLMVSLITRFTLTDAVPCRFVDFYQLCARIRATFGDRGNESEASILEPLVAVPVLVLDDLGKGQGTAWELTVVDQIITRRYNAGRIIFATSNFLPEEALKARDERMLRDGHVPKSSRRDESLEERIDGRLVSRLRQNCELLVLDGVSDYRARARS